MRFKQIVETTTAGSVATVAQPMMTQSRENTNVRGLKPVQQLMKGKASKKGPYANSIVESKVTEDDLAEQDLIVVPGQGRLKRTGFVKHDLDQGEHEGHTLKNSLHTIARAASDLDKRLSVQSEFPEWVSEKIGAAKGMMVTVMDYLISSQEMQQDRDAMYEDMSNTDYTPQVGEEILWRSRNPMNKMMPVPGTVLAIAPGKVTIKIKSPRLIQNIGKDTIVLKLSDYVLMPKQGVAEGEKNTSYMNKQNQDFYNKNPNFKRDDRGVKFVGKKLASIVTPTNKPGQVAKKPMTPFNTQGVPEASNTMQRYGQKIIKQAKAARAAELEPKKEEPPASSDYDSMSTRDFMKQLRDQRRPKKQGVAEGRMVRGPGGMPLDRQGNPKVAKPAMPAAPKLSSPKLTISDVWRKVEEVVSQIYPDGDPIDWLLPWFRKQGIADHKVGDILAKAARKNGYKDIYDYYYSMGDDLGEGVAEGWKDEANDYKEWSNHVKNELLSVAPSQQYSMALRLSQIERKHFGSEIETGFNTQTGRPDSTSNKGLTGTVSQIYSAIKDGSLGAAAPAAGAQSTAFGTVTRPADQPDPYHASPALTGGDSQAALNSLKGDSNYPAATTLSGPSSGIIKILRTEEEWEEALNNQDSGADGPMTAAGFGAAIAKLPSWKVMLATIMLASKLPIIGDKIKNNIISSIKNEFGVQMSFKEALGYMQHVRTTPPDEIVSPAVWKFEKDGGDYETAIEQLPDDEVNVSPAHVMATISNDLISSGLAQEIKPEKEEKRLQNKTVEEGAMPASVIRVKEKIRLMTDAEKKEYFKGKTQAQLQQMARRHGYGENSNVYAKYATQGVTEVSDATKASYKEKATQQVKDLTPHAKKGEYKDIAQNMISRRQKGIDRVTARGVAENTATGINKMFNNLFDPVYSNLQRVALLAMQGRQSEAAGRLQSVIKDASTDIQKKITDAVNNIKPVTINGKIADSSTLNKSKQHNDWIINTFIPWVQSLLGKQGVAEGKIDFAKKLQKNVDKSNKAVVKTRQDIGSRIADIGAGGKEYNVKTDAAWDAAKKKVAEGSAPKEKQKTP